MLAFCFLVYDTLQHPEIWEKFFESADGCKDYTIYSHLKKVTPDSHPILKKNKVKTVKTAWCSEGLIWAFNSMLRKALKNKDNSYFILLSGACIPLYNYSITYKKITRDPEGRGRMNYYCLDGVPFRDRDDIYFGHQWVILNRKLAEDYLSLQKDKKFLRYFRNLYSQNGVIVGRRDKGAKEKEDSTWSGGCPDEIYPINYLLYLYGSNLDHLVINRAPTYTLWDFDKDPSHPQILDVEDVKKEYKSIYNGSHLFGRKFTKEAVKYLIKEIYN